MENQINSGNISSKDKDIIFNILEKILQELSVQVWIKDNELRYIYANDNMKIADKIPNVDVIGKKDEELYDQVRAKMFWETDHATITAKERFSSSYLIDGETYEEVQKQAFYSKDGKFLGIFGYAKDVTSEKLLEKHSQIIAISDARFRRVFHNAPIGIVVFNTREQRPVLLNSKFAQILGRSVEEVLEGNWKDYLAKGEEKRTKFELLDNLRLDEIENYSVEQRFAKPDGSIVYVKLTNATYEIDENGVHFTICMMEDITKRKSIEEELVKMSHTDMLTGLYNRNYLIQEMDSISDNLPEPFSVIMGDVNGLKICNDAFGHYQGDQLICAVAKAFSENISDIPNSFAARIGGDEFLAVLPGVDYDLAEKIGAKIKQDALEASSPLTVYSVSIGIASLRDTEPDIETMIVRAETRMYSDKLIMNKKLGDKIVEKVLNLLVTDPLEKAHMRNVAMYAENLADVLGLSINQKYDLVLAAQLHDIGMVVCELDRKEPGRPIGQIKGEDELTKKHSEIGYRLLKYAETYSNMARFVLSHHENIDGSGYPAGIMGDDIPLESRIIRLADFYDSMSNPSFGYNLSKQEIIDEINKYKGKYFDAYLSELFIDNVILNKEI